jgi:protein arginine kinase activator
MFHTCDRCDSPATFHLTEIKSGTTSERHLCEECAKVLQVPQANKELQNLLKSFDPGQVMSQQPEASARRTCPDCGMTYAEFRQNGRFGCSKDYEIFSKEVVALLDRIHGSNTYSGKTPDGGLIQDGQLIDETSAVREQLTTAIKAEDYEEAARLRDEIQRLTGRLGSGQSADATEQE